MDFSTAAADLGKVIGGALGNNNSATPAKKPIMSKQSDSDPDNVGTAPANSPRSYKKGGKVRKTGLAKLHKGERVLTKQQARKYERKKGSK